MTWLRDAEAGLLAAIRGAISADADHVERGDRNADQVASLPFAFTGGPSVVFDREAGRQLRATAQLGALAILAPIDGIQARHDALTAAAEAISAAVEADPTLGGAVYDALIVGMDVNEFPDSQTGNILLVCEVVVYP